MAEKNTISFENLMKDLKNQIYHPVYLLFGEESYFIDEISNFIENHVLSDDEKEFNQTIIYGRDTDVATLVSYARRYPMMANYQVLIVKEAQDLSRIEDLQAYIEHPLASTLLVLCYKYGKVDRRKGFFKAVEKTGIVFESASLYDNRIPEWITEYLRPLQFSISPKAAVMLTEFLGTDLSRIVNELQKLLINIPAGSTITEEVVERNIGISKDFNVFELQKALIAKDVVKANRIIRYFAANPRENPLVKVIPILFAFFQKVLAYHYLTDKSQNAAASELGVRPFLVGEYQRAARAFPTGKVMTIIGLLREYDLKSKGFDNASATDGELMKELIFRILH
ncbi:MAG TPA: DNA polymerase III subunit delta [Bacteroidales bacterium]|nr:DNA polymerase III subunit delta [Bacteroidales bacterium]HPS61559.1 DNA polymerase III subunit delta [Bacteroidales bacterium]